ncbi:MAG: hypothetical protein HUU26_12635 [Gemmatimonadaceae bacterium]|nr:hypothetical protein [Gemmatimonadaceae bacterium]
MIGHEEIADGALGRWPPASFQYPPPGGPLEHPRLYKGFTLTPRTFQVRGTGLWTLDVTIGRLGSLRAFSGPDLYPNERDATVACWQMACRIIDASPPDSRVADLSERT